MAGPMKPGNVAKVFVSPIIAPVHVNMSTNVSILKMHRLVNSLQNARVLLSPNDVSRSDFIFYLWTFLTRTIIAARRCSGAPSKVYQWLGPKCRHKMTRKHFANHSPNFYRRSKSAKFGLDFQNQSPLTALVSKLSNILLIFIKFHKFNDGPLTC